MPRYDRRLSERIEVESALTAFLVTPGQGEIRVDVVKVLNVSFGGFLAESAIRFDPGATYEFRFESLGKKSAPFKARAIYAVERPAVREDARHACGFAFLNADDPFTLWRIRDLIKKVTSALDADRTPDEPHPDPRIA